MGRRIDPLSAVPAAGGSARGGQILAGRLFFTEGAKYAKKRLFLPPAAEEIIPLRGLRDFCKNFFSFNNNGLGSGISSFPNQW